MLSSRRKSQSLASTKRIHKASDRTLSARNGVPGERSLTSENLNSSLGQLSKYPLSIMIPTQLDVIKCMKRFKCPAFSPDRSARAKIRKEYAAFSKMPEKLRKKISLRKKQTQVDVPQSYNKLGTLLRKMEETDRILRQEPDFLVKLRDSKPGIKLSKSEKVENSGKKKNKRKRTTTNMNVFPKSPCKIPNSMVNLGIMY